MAARIPDVATIQVDAEQEQSLIGRRGGPGEPRRPRNPLRAGLAARDSRAARILPIATLR